MCLDSVIAGEDLEASGIAHKVARRNRVLSRQGGLPVYEGPFYSQPPYLLNTWQTADPGPWEPVRYVLGFHLFERKEDAATHIIFWSLPAETRVLQVQWRIQLARGPWRNRPYGLVPCIVCREMYIEWPQPLLASEIARATEEPA